MILNLVISIFGIVNIINLNLKKCLELKVKPIQNPFFLLSIPTSFLFLVQNSTTILLLSAILFYYILEKNKNFLSGKIICLNKTYFIVVTLSIFWPFLLIVSLLSKSLFGEFQEQKIVTYLRINGLNLDNIEILFTTIILSPIIEEILFRVLIYATLKNYIGIFFSSLISSIIFSFVHYNLHSFFTLFFLGIILCLIYEKYGSIKYVILCHSIFNAIMIFLILRS